MCRASRYHMLDTAHAASHRYICFIAKLHDKGPSC
jgi:hypothetical protein